MNPTSMFIAIGPGEPLDTFLHSAKSRVHEAVGDHLYLSDPPHLTLYLAAFDDPDAVLSLVDGLSRGMSAFEVAFDDWFVFERDPLTGGNTPVCRIEEPASSFLRRLQRSIVETLSPIRNPQASRERYIGQWSTLSPIRQQSVERTGFPYTGDDWLPHFSVASIRPDDWEAAWSVLKDRPPTGTFSCDWLRVYRLDGIEPVLLSEIRLRFGP